jgi:hypothetical protein
MADTSPAGKSRRGGKGDGKREGGKGGRRDGEKKEGGKGDRPPRERKPREELPTVEDPKAELDKVMAAGEPPKPNPSSMETEVAAIQREIDEGKRRTDEITKELDDIKEKNERAKSASAVPLQTTRAELSAVKKEIVGVIEERKRISARIDEIRAKKGEQDEAIKKQRSYIGRFSSNDSIDAEIARIEEHMAHTSMSLKQEKDYIAQIKELNKKRDDVKQLEIMEGKRGAGAGQLSLTELFDSRKEVDDRITALRATEKAAVEKLSGLREKSQSKDPDRFPMLRDERTKIRDQNKTRIDAIREKRGEFKKLEDAWYAHERLVKNLKWQLRQKQNAEREARDKERAEKQAAAPEEPKEDEEGDKKETMMDWDLADRIMKIEQLIGFLDGYLPKEQAKKEEVVKTKLEGGFEKSAALEEDPLGLNAFMVDEVVSKKKGKKDKKKKANAAKNDISALLANGDTVQMQLTMEMIQEFGKMSLPVPVDSDDAAGSIAQLKEKLAYYNEQGEAGLTLKEVIKKEKAARHASKHGKKGAAEPEAEKTEGEEFDLAALRKAAQGKQMSEEEKKARGLLYDTSKARACREESSDDEEGVLTPVVSISVDGPAPKVTVTLKEDDCAFDGGDPFEGL